MKCYNVIVTTFKDLIKTSSVMVDDKNEILLDYELFLVSNFPRRLIENLLFLSLLKV